jgi:hypothetical protein
MLGEKLGESRGKMTGTRVLPSEGHCVKVEVSFQGKGQILGREISDMGTYWQTVRGDGVFYGEGTVLLMTKEGDSAHWTGFGIGRPAGPAPAGRYAVCGSFQRASERLHRLTTTATVTEYEVDEQGSYHWTMWEWKAQP